MVGEAVAKSMEISTEILIHKVKELTVSLNMTSVAFEADQKSIKPRIVVYPTTTKKEIDDLISLGMQGIDSARDEIEQHGFDPSPLNGVTTRQNRI